MVARCYIEATLSAGLPTQTRWMIHGTPLEFVFEVSRLGMQRLPAEVLDVGDSRESALLMFGEQDFAEGGGACPWLCVSEPDGLVYGFDPEREQSMFLLNSSVEQFVATFRLLDDFLAIGRQLPPDCHIRLRNIDPEAYLNSDWRLLVECVQSAESEDARERR